MAEGTQGTERRARTPGREDKNPYDMQRALSEANRLLKQEFGDVDQGAAVSLAQFLYSVHEREEFMHRKEGTESYRYGDQQTM